MTHKIAAGGNFPVPKCLFKHTVADYYCPVSIWPAHNKAISASTPPRL